MATTEEKTEFLREMSRSIAEKKDSGIDADWVLYAIGIFVCFAIFLIWANAHRDRIRARWIIWKKLLKGELKASDRYRLAADLVIDLPSGESRVTHTTTVNLSVNGMYVKMNPPLNVGDLFKFRILFPDGPHIGGMAEVVWAQNRWKPERPTGVGCRFKDLANPDDANRIRLWLNKQKLPKV